MLLHRTCYGIGPYGPDAFPEDLGPSEALARDGYIFVYQDVRGKMMSEGVFQEMTPLTDGRGVDEATDAWDTIDWVLKQVPGNNGRVGAWGISYPGFYAACALVGAHPALKAVSPQAPMSDLFAGDDDHHNGALFLAQTFWFDAVYGLPRPQPTDQEPREPALLHSDPDGYQFFLDLGALPNADARYFHGQVRVWSDEMAHGADDAYWRARDLRPHLQPGGPATLTVGGWFDPEDLFGTLQVHRRLAPATSWSWAPGTTAAGPTAPATAWARRSFGSATAAFYQARIEAPFFRHHLKGGPDPGLAQATVFDTGTNAWRRFNAWPPPEPGPPRSYLQAGGRLGFQPPPGASGRRRLRERSRPPGALHRRHRGPGRRPPSCWRTSASPPGARTCWSTRPRSSTGPLTVAGPVQARLQVSTAGTDADWVVKLIDVLPGESGDPEPRPATGLPPGRLPAPGAGAR